MIVYVKLSNFESHVDSYLEFSNGVNCIVGQSDSGKSSILRAINWVITNRPAGDSFRTHNAGDTVVEIATNTGATVRRVKGAGRNEYWVNDLKLTGFGQDVPPEVSQALNMLPVNYQPQFDAHYLLPPVSPGEVARQLNEVVNLEVIDTTLSNINSSIRENTQHLKAVNEAVKEHDTELESMAYLTKAEADLRKLEKADRTFMEIADSAESLGALILGIQDIEIKLVRYANVSEAGKAISTLDGIAKAKGEVEEKYSILSVLIKNIKDFDEEYAEVTKKGEEAEKAFKMRFPKVCPLCGQEVKKNA
jgi:DNA repair protein SbcC/Rad50